MKKTIFIGMVVLIAATLSAGGPPLLQKGESAELFEGFEGKIKWYAVKDTWKDNDSSIGVEKSSAFATEGSSSLAGKFAMNGKNGAAFYSEGFKPIDWSVFKALGVDVKNGTDKKLEMVCAVCTGEAWTWQESAVVVLKPGETVKDVRFDFNEKTWKSSVTGWKNTAALSGLKLTQRFVFKFFGDKGIAGEVFIDNLRLVK